MTQNLAYIVSNIDKAVAFEWIASDFRTHGREISFILLNPGDSHLETFLRANGFTVERVLYRGKRDLIPAILKVRKILKTWQSDTVHAHLFDASLVGLFAAKMAGVPKRIHTRHAGILHHKYHPHAVKYDRWINRLSTHIVSISAITTKILVGMEQVDPSKIRLIHHGFKLAEFSDGDPERIGQVKERHHLPSGKKLIGVISRYIEWKGIQYIVPAFGELLAKHPDVHLVLCGASGPYTAEIRSLLAALPANSFTEIVFEPDNAALIHCFDLCVHVPADELSEAFGQVYIECMAAHVPLVATKSGIGTDILTDRRNALVVPYQNSRAIEEAMNELITNLALREEIAENAFEDVRQFSLENMIGDLQRLYNE